MDQQIDELITQGEAFNKKYSKTDSIPLGLYGGMGLMGGLAIWTFVSALSGKKESEQYVDERGERLSPATVNRLVREGEATLLDMES